jgi:hypothetical protein
MPSVTREHPKSVAALGAPLAGIAAAGFVAALIGASGPFLLIAGVAGVIVAAMSVPVLHRMAKEGRLGPVRRSGGVGEQDAQPVTE